jgi:hypothetical protein
MHNANQEHPRPIQTTSNPMTEETLVKEILKKLEKITLK